MALSHKQQAFVAAYLRTLNATRAAVEAGYSEGTARQQGSRLLSNADIRAAVDAGLDDMAMPAREVLARYTAMAQGDLTAFLDLDEAELKQHPQSFLVKKFKRTTRTLGKDTETTLEVELYDAQAALAQLGKYHRLFADRLEVDWRGEIEQIGLDPDAALSELERQFVDHLRQGAAGAAARGVDAGESEA